ncbi:MAG: class I tRNA ligase family protein, partial [Verrucomicrobiota bacterium]
VDEITVKVKALWDKLDVRYDRWAATTDPVHKKCVQGILQRLWDEKEIYKDKQAGYYSVRQEQFLTDKERGPDGEFGPEWGTVEFREEENYYFKLSEHKDWLLAYLAGRKDAVIPDYRQTELRNGVEKISGDLCISRPKSRLDWGIELPFDKDYVTYVWFDALTNYISFIDYDPAAVSYELQPSSFRDKWPALHVIGKDILIPAHGIYWLIMLHALGFPDDAMPQLLVHGWWNLGGTKISKSAGNMIDPDALVDKYGDDALRYYLMSDIATGKDADFSEDLLVQRYNSDLANNLGNLLNRSLNMTQRYLSGQIERSDSDPTSNTVKDEAADVVKNYGDWLNKFSADAALTAASFLASRCNQIIDRDAPWKMAKDESQKTKLSNLLYSLCESLRIIAILISPVLPKAAHGIFDQLNWKMELSRNDERFRLDDAKWGGLPDGHVVGKPVPLFPRIETSSAL